MPRMNERVLNWLVAGAVALLGGCRETATAPSNVSLPGGDAGATTDSSQGATSTAGANGPVGEIRFASMRERSGIDFVHRTGDSSEKPFPAANGSGIAAWDYDLDGRPDLYFATGNDFPVELRPENASNRLYRSTGDWKFSETTSASGTGHRGYTAGLAVGDYNSDGFPDLYLNCYGRNVLLQNLGDGTFEDVSDASGVADERWGTSAAFVDIDGNGLPDLYVGNYAIWSLETNQFCGDRERGIRMFCGPPTVHPELDGLYRNLGDGTFEEISEATGINAKPARTQGVLVGDFNGDGFNDLYLGNDLNPNGLLLNQKDGTFRDEGEASGSAYDRVGKMQAGMGVTAADANRDGAFDLFVTNYEGEHNTYYENDGLGMYQDVSHARGLAAQSIPWVGWGTWLGDFDIDGWPDVLVVNGHTDDNLAEMGREGEFRQPPLVWRNLEGRFQVVKDAGPHFAGKHPARALAVADLDGDGDLDAVAGHQDAAPELLSNESPATSRRPACWLTLIGLESNRDAVGTVVALEQSGRRIVEQVLGGGSYLSASDRAVLLVPLEDPGAGPVTLSVRWPGGRETRATLLSGPGRYRIIEPAPGGAECRVLAGP
ncbi:MAG: VCBS repeat-containing protein [Planctomyces sp.]|nr:VCBS repeat-containing protein [Planctomyces sp.]